MSNIASIPPSPDHCQTANTSNKTVSPCVPLSDYHHHGIQYMTLQNHEQWAEFHAIGNEMMVINRGRELFPKLEIKFSNLSPDGLYICGVKLLRPNGNKYRFDGKKKEWVQTDKKVPFEQFTNERLFEPMKGADLECGRLDKDLAGIKIYNVGMDSKKGGRSMKKLKGVELVRAKRLAEKQVREQIQIDTLCAYIPVVTLYLIDPVSNFYTILSQSLFQEAEFIVVTGYANTEIAILKSQQNKYRAVNHPCNKKISKPTQPKESTSPPVSVSSSPSTPALSHFSPEFPAPPVPFDYYQIPPGPVTSISSPSSSLSSPPSFHDYPPDSSVYFYQESFHYYQGLLDYIQFQNDFPLTEGVYEFTNL